MNSDSNTYKKCSKKSVLERFYPDYVFIKVEDIPYELLKEENIKLILMDMDNTLIDKSGKYSTNLKKWIKDIRSKGINMYIISNTYSLKKIKKVSKELGLKYICKANKPSRKSLTKIYEQYPDIQKSEMLMIGDQIFTDVYVANRFNIKSVLVKRIENKEIFITKFKRPLERLILNKYYKMEENSKKCKI